MCSALAVRKLRIEDVVDFVEEYLVNASKRSSVRCEVWGCLAVEETKVELDPESVILRSESKDETLKISEFLERRDFFPQQVLTLL